MRIFAVSLSGETEFLAPPSPPADTKDMCLLVALIFLGFLIGPLIDMLIDWGMGR